MKTLDEMLEKWQIHPPGMWENDNGPKGWYAVSNDDGILAYFAHESAANGWRLTMINIELNQEPVF